MTVEEKLIASLEEFTERLKSGEPIVGVKVIRCPCGGDKDCKGCHGAGYYRTVTTLTDQTPNHNPEE